MPTLRYYDGAAYQPLPGMAGPTGPLGPAGPTGAQGPVAPGVTQNYVVQGWGPTANYTSTQPLTVVAPALQANHNYLVSAWAIASNVSAAAAACRIYVSTTSPAGTGPNQGVYLTYEANLAADFTGVGAWSKGASGSFIYTPAVNGDVSFTIFSVGTAGAFQFAPNQCAIFVMDMTGTQGPIGATGPSGPAGPAGGGSTIVSVRAIRNAAYTVPASIAGFVFDTKQWDTQNAFNVTTGTFICPQAGKYRFTAQAVVTSTATGQSCNLQIQKTPSGGSASPISQCYSAYASGASQFLFAQVVDTIDMAVGDALNFWLYAPGSSGLALNTSAVNTYLTIDLLSGTGPQGATGPAGPPAAVGQMYSLVYYQTIPAPKVASSPYTVTHNLGTTFPMVQLWDASTLQLVNAQVQVVDANRVQIAVAADMPNPVNVSIMGVAASPVPVNPGDLATKSYVDAKTATLPAPVTSGSTIQSFTDVLGDVWVAKNGVNGGAWRRARDVLFAYYLKSAAFNLGTTGVVIAYDNLNNDAYGIYSPSTGIMTPPVAGLYEASHSLSATPTASGQYIGNQIMKNGASVTNATVHCSSAIWFTNFSSVARLLIATDTMGVGGSASVAMVMRNESWVQFKYEGTG